MAKEEDAKKMAYRMARYMGCSGVHQNENGTWMPCRSQEELMRRSDSAEPKKKSMPVDNPTRKRRKRRGKNWEKLRERGVLGIATLPGGGLVSGTGVGGKAVKSFLYGRAKPRLGDPDVFTSPDGARLRARDLGCIGIARRETPDGDVVWTPCTNVSDYRRRTGRGVQARRDRDRREGQMMRRLERRLRRRGVAVEGKAAKKPVFDPKARDADGDGVVQDGTPFERPDVVGAADTLSQVADLKKLIKPGSLKSDLSALEDIEQKLADPSSYRIKKVRKARSDRLAATPSLPKERISGSSKNPKGSAASASSGSKIDLDEATIQAIKNKVKEHNKKMREQGKPRHTMASTGRLKSVWRRGAGAFSASHRPGMTRSQWAIARVNAFLYVLEKGKPRNKRYTTDNDLLPKGHPLKMKSAPDTKSVNNQDI